MRRLSLLLILGCGGSEHDVTNGSIGEAVSWISVHDGIDQFGSKIPRSGVRNGTLQRALGVAVEPYGTQEELAGKTFVAGRVSHFGGPNDRGVTASETGAISGERLRSLNNPLNPSAATLAARPEDYYYVAMRFDYSPNGGRWWANARLLVVNPSDGRGVVVRPVDWGPNTHTARIIDLSPQAVDDLGVTTDDRVYVAFAAPGTPLGVVAPASNPDPDPNPSAEIIVDNSDPLRFRASESWGTSDYAEGRIGADYRYRSPELTSDPAEFRIPIEEAGSYEVFARAPGRGYNSDVPYVIHGADGPVIVSRDTSSTEDWISLGTHPFEVGDDWIVQISCWTTGTGYIIADAIKLERRP
jgi:hypothetical protein